MARPLKIAWKHPAKVFYQLYEQEVDARIAKRWQALWVLRQGERLKRVREVGGQPQADLAGSQGVEGGRGVVWDDAAFFTRRRRWERGAPYAPESCGAGVCGGSAVGRRA